jgi:hypothetical protein
MERWVRGGSEIGRDHSPRDFPGGCVVYSRRTQGPRPKVAPVGREADGVPVRCGVSTEPIDRQQTSEMNRISHQTPETKPTAPNQLRHSDSPPQVRL